jgi:bifunctional NMN adenylyltransferase/nudix hydrolase
MENKKQFDALVFCGRFQPFHIGHKTVIDRALEMAKEVVVVVGSSFQARSTKNPFTFEERKAMIRAVYPQDSVKVVPVMDYPYDDNAWVSAVQNAVNCALSSTWSDFPKKIGLIGHAKDSSSYYLNIFPQWRNHVEVENIDGINATDIRRDLFENWCFKDSYDMIPELVRDHVMDKIIMTRPCFEGCYSQTFEDLSEEYDQIKEYRKSWAAAPYEPTFVTTDAVLTQSGHILLIKRGGFPFKDCWALPGGYLAKGQFIVDNMIKELREETCIKVPEKVLRGSIKDVQVFDHPDRDPRGRTITHGFYIDLGFPSEKLPRVKGADDAIHAEWIPLGELKREMFAFDHWHIIQRFIPTY